MIAASDWREIDRKENQINLFCNKELQDVLLCKLSPTNSS